MGRDGISALRYSVATLAGEACLNVAHDPEGGRYVIQDLADGLAVPDEVGAAADRAGAMADLMHHIVSGQMFRQWLAAWLGLCPWRFRSPRMTVAISASAASMSSSANSSCSMLRSIFSEDAPKRARLRTASCAFSFSIRVSRDWRLLALTEVAEPARR